MRRADWFLGGLMGAIHFTFHVYLRLIPPLIPVFALAFALPLWRLGLFMSLYFTGSTLGLLPMGHLSDAYDRRVLLPAALAVVAGGFLLFAAAPTIGAGLPTVVLAGESFEGPFVVMGLAMVVAGLGSSAHIPVGVPLITRNASSESTGTVLGIWGGASKLGDAAAPAMVGVLILGVAWQDILQGFGLVGLGLAAGLYLLLGADRFDTSPAGIDADPDEPAWNPWEADRRRYIYPMLALAGYFALYNVVVQGVVTFTPTFVTDVYGYTLTLGGIHFAPESFADFALSFLLIAAAIARFVGGVLVDRSEGRTVLVGTLVLASVALFAFARLPLDPLAMLIVLAVFGMGLWGNSPARDALISELTPAEREGRTFSYLWTVSRAFGAISPAVVGYLADTAGVRAGFALLSVATLLAAGAVALLFSDRVYRTSSPQPPLAAED